MSRPQISGYEPYRHPLSIPSVRTFDPKARIKRAPWQFFNDFTGSTSGFTIRKTKHSKIFSSTGMSECHNLDSFECPSILPNVKISDQSARNQSTRIITLRSGGRRAVEPIHSLERTRIASAAAPADSRKGSTNLNARRPILSNVSFFFSRYYIPDGPRASRHQVSSFSSHLGGSPSLSRHDHREPRSSAPSFSPRDLSHARGKQLDGVEKPTLRGNGELPAACILPTASGSSTYLAESSLRTRRRRATSNPRPLFVAAIPYVRSGRVAEPERRVRAVGGTNIRRMDAATKPPNDGDRADHPMVETTVAGGTISHGLVDRVLDSGDADCSPQ
ncbi:hypothetical protein DBV15_08144 [Temnothorax longispinosus]|uniref:Uncharacterized protein n=1 Tax=Temnothorax longispinosus TaxID=300112 RepID=A0A4S2L1X9_9HYME|nr:hypothetical protein DBV15_08144 [Temnothorax longispinosus]